MPDLSPWVDSKYGDSNYPRILVLGESSYDEGAMDDGTIAWRKRPTHRVVEAWVKGDRDRHLSIFTKIDRALSRTLEWDDGSSFDRIIFYNFIQQFLSGNRVGPKEEMVRESDNAFQKVLDTFAPTHLLACGYRLWGLMPHTGERLVPLQVDGRDFDLWRYPTKTGSTTCIRLKHPSSGWSYSDWEPALKKFLS